MLIFRSQYRRWLILFIEKGAKRNLTSEMCIFWRYAIFIFFHLILMHFYLSWIDWQEFQKVFQQIFSINFGVPFQVKLKYNKTNWCRKKPFVDLPCCAWHSPFIHTSQTKCWIITGLPLLKIFKIPSPILIKFSPPVPIT